MDEDAIIEVDYIYSDKIRFGYYGDMNKFPYGIHFYYFKSYMQASSALAMYYKTDFDTNYDLKLNLNHSFRVLKRQITTSLIFQKREYYDLNINDYKLFFSNPLKIITPKAGFALKYDYPREALDKAVILGFSKYIQPTLSKIYTNISFYKDFSEFNIGIEQRLTNKETMWQNFSFGMIYQKYREYNELNLFVNYTFFYEHGFVRGFYSHH